MWVWVIKQFVSEPQTFYFQPCRPQVSPVSYRVLLCLLCCAWWPICSLFKWPVSPHHLWVCLQLCCLFMALLSIIILVPGRGYFSPIFLLLSCCSNWSLGSFFLTKSLLIFQGSQMGCSWNLNFLHLPRVTL